jgi:Domain of unknown function (DUF1906)
MPTLPPLLGCDLASRLTPTLIRSLQSRGYVAAGRYTKSLTKAEIAACVANDFGLWFIHEGEGDLATMQLGQARGRADGIVAVESLRALGINEAVVFSAADFPATADQVKIVTAYELGFASAVAPHTPGLYGDGVVLQATDPTTKCYLAGAKGWPGYDEFLASGRAAIVQRSTITVAGIEIDPCDIYDTGVIWWPNGTVVQPITSNPKPADPATKHMPALATLQQWLIADGQLPANSADGIWGPRTATAVAKAYGAS